MSTIYKAFFGLILFQSSISYSQGKIVMNGGKLTMKNSVYVVTKDVSLTNPSTLIADNSTLRVAGTISSNNNIDVQGGTLEMNGTTAQTIPGASFTGNKIRNLIISNDVTLAGQDSITNVLSFGAVNSKTFSTGGYLTLKSTAAGTAIVADLTNSDVNSGNQVLGDVTAERYLSSVKKWRLLTVPTSTTQTIKEAWQEGSITPNDNLVGGYGTQITGPGGTAAGFDMYTASPSMKTYNAGTNNFVSVPNTNAALINTPANNTVAYYVFVRGDRTATAFASPVTATTLRTKGEIKQGDQSPITIAAPATAMTVVGNPYPSYIDLRRMSPAPTFGTKIYVWDPMATIGSAYGLGAYQTLTFDGSDFTVTPGGGSYGAPYNQDSNRIESGSAFFVGGNATPYNITFHEDIKPSGNFIISSPIRKKEYLQANLFINANGVTSLMDGIRADIGNQFLNVLDDNDAYKISNSSENVSIKRNGKLLSVERHNTINASDTFFLNIANMKAQNYRWQLNMQNLDQPGLSGFLKDSYVNSSTALNLNGSNTIDFTVNNAAGSYASNRFMIVFSAAKVLSVTFTNVKAYRQNADINVEWNVENESNIKEYEVEKSTDGNVYKKVNTTAARNIPVSQYAWADGDAQAGYNYYRIKSMDANGKIEYSKVVKVIIETGKGSPSISVYPNPVTGKVIYIQFNNIKKGNYSLQLFNESGQLISTKTILHNTAVSSESVEINKRFAAGKYDIKLFGEGIMLTTPLIKK